jgi:hypothetical protein
MPNTYHRNDDVVIDPNHFACLASQYQHLKTSLNGVCGSAGHFDQP